MGARISDSQRALNLKYRRSHSTRHRSQMGFEECFCPAQVDRIAKFLASIMQEHNLRRNDGMDRWAIRQHTRIERRA